MPYLELEKSYTVYLKEKGEMCNRLARGTRVILREIKGDWVKITWRKVKKRLDFLPESL